MYIIARLSLASAKFCFTFALNKCSGALAISSDVDMGSSGTGTGLTLAVFCLALAEERSLT